MIKIVPMNESHVAQVAALEKACFSMPWSENSIASELRNELALWLVAVDGGRVVGYVGSQTVFPETDMMNIAVTLERRREGTLTLGDLPRGVVRELTVAEIDALETVHIDD